MWDSVWAWTIKDLIESNQQKKSIWAENQEDWVSVLFVTIWGKEKEE